MTKLAARPLLDTPAQLAHPGHNPERVDLDDPALAVMTDLLVRPAITIKGDDSLPYAEKLMSSAGVRLLLVVDGRQELEGLMTYRDLRGERAMAAAAKDKISHDRLSVTQVMTRAPQIETVSLNAVEHARVRDIVELLREHGRQHMLVTEQGNRSGAVAVRGIFSITQIGRLLGLSISANERAQSFAEIEQLIAAE